MPAHIPKASAKSILLFLGILSQVMAIEVSADTAGEIPTKWGGKKGAVTLAYKLHGNTRSIYAVCNLGPLRGSKSRRVAADACGLQSNWSSSKYLYTTDVEHLKPASTFGGCYDRVAERRANGEEVNPREWCAKHDPEYSAAYHDPWNLMAAVSEINRARGADPFCEIEGEVSSYGVPDVEHNGDCLEPPEISRGEIAHRFFRFWERHPTIKVTYSEVMLMFRWQDYPISLEGQERIDRLEEWSGY